MVHLAMHDAVNMIQPRYATFGAANTGHPEADAAVAAIVAAHDVLASLYPAQQQRLASELASALLDAGTGEAVEKGRVVGKQAAVAVLAARAADGHAGSEEYKEAEAPGRYRFVPQTNFILMPHWRKVKPFALGSPDQFRSPAPPALNSALYARDFDEVRSAGGKQGATGRTADQSHYAGFWYELSDQGWNRVARTVAKSRPQNLWQSARTFALLNVAMADAYIAGWDSKLHHDFWRPVTAIRVAGTDGNPQTREDPSWESFLPTPPIQDYPSTHSALGAAAAAVLAHSFGSDRIPFSFASPTAGKAQSTRSFKSFSHAANENADSRVRAGLHFRFATVEGLRLGKRVGDHAIRNLLAPVH